MSDSETSRTSFEQIRDDFSYLEDWEDRYRYLIELGRRLEPLPDAERTDANKVRGCASQVWLWTRHGANDPAQLRFVGDSDAHIVRGLIAVVLALFDGRTPEEIEQIDAEQHFAELRLAEHLSSQRSNGLRAMVKRIKADARAALVAQRST
jgi:cysteine desulfuration protein SufE